MAEVNAKVMEVIEAELKKNPDASNQALFEKATEVDKSIAKLTPRQFNARYPLQVKRSMAPQKAKPRRRAASRKSGRATQQRAEEGKGREKVRGVLMELAREVANAQDNGQLMDVIMGVDRYVDRVLKATS